MLASSWAMRALPQIPPQQARSIGAQRAPLWSLWGKQRSFPMRGAVPLSRNIFIALASVFGLVFGTCFYLCGLCIAVMVATTPGSKKAKASSTRQAASLIAALGALLQYQTSSTILTTKHTSSTVPMQSSPRTNGGSLALAVGSAFWGVTDHYSLWISSTNWLKTISPFRVRIFSPCSNSTAQSCRLQCRCPHRWLAGAIDNTAHNGDFYRFFEALFFQAALHLVGNFDHGVLGAAAGGS